MAGKAPIRIRIGAALDSSVEKVFASMEARAQKAAKLMGAAQKGAARVGAETAKKTGDEYDQAFDKIGKAARTRLDGVSRAFKEISRVAERELNRQTKAVYRETLKQQRQIEGANRRAGESFARRTSYRAARFFAPNAPIASAARRVGSDILRGAGVDFDLSSSVRRGVSLDSQAVALSNAAYQPGGAGAAGTRQDPRRLAALARTVGKEQAFDPEKVLGGLQKFTALTGDLETGEAILGQMAKLAGATGAELDDVQEAAANVSATLGDVPNKADKVARVMRVVAGQGKLGAVEMKDLASQMAKIASAAPQFAGDTGQNIVKLSALAQLARQTGGASSAREATTSVARFAESLTKKQGLKRFQALGIQTVDRHNQVVDPLELIRRSLIKTRGNLPAMSQLFSGSIGAKPVKALTSLFNAAGGGKSGLAAVNAELDKFVKRAEMSEGEIAESNKARMATEAAKAQKFQNQLDEVIAAMAEKILPALEKIEDPALKLAEVLGRVATWTVENPKLAIGTAIGLAIARASIESSIRSGLERLLLGAGGQRAGALGGAASTIGAGLTVAALAATAISVGMMTIDHLFAKDAEMQKRKVKATTDVANLDSQVAGALGRGDTKAARGLLEKDVGATKTSLATLEDNKSGGFRRGFDSLLSMIPGLDTTALANRQKAEDRGVTEMKGHLEEMTTLLRRLVEQGDAPDYSNGPAPEPGVGP